MFGEGAVPKTNVSPFMSPQKHLRAILSDLMIVLSLPRSG